MLSVHPLCLLGSNGYHNYAHRVPLLAALGFPDGFRCVGNTPDHLCKSDTNSHHRQDSSSKNA